MHHDGTEHDWKVLTVWEQGFLMPAWTLCSVCHLSAWELLFGEAMPPIRWSTAQRAAPDSGDEDANSSAQSVDTTSRAVTSTEVPKELSDMAAWDKAYAVNSFNLMFSGVGYDPEDMLTVRPTPDN